MPPITRSTTRANAKHSHSLSEDGNVSVDAHSPKKRRRSSSSRNAEESEPPMRSGSADSPIPKGTESSNQTNSGAWRAVSPDLAIYTIGHSTLSLQDLTALLRHGCVSHLVDVRAFPKSRTNPQFNRDALESSLDLKRMNITYKWLGTALGGRRKAIDGAEKNSSLLVAQFRYYAAYMTTPEFKSGLEELKDMARQAAKEGKRVVIMCAEAVYWRCHRRLIADRLVADGWVVKHMGLRAGEPVKHAMWNIARITPSGDLVYDGPEDSK